MPITRARWPFIAVGIGFLVAGALHFIAWLFIVFVYHANSIPDVRRSYLPVYALLGAFGVWMFLLAILVGIAAGVMLMTSRDCGRGWALAAAILNLPVLPLGTVLGAAASSVLVFTRQTRA
jgi:hypothetical protein